MRRCQQHKAPQYWYLIDLIVLRQPRTLPVDSDYALPVVTNLCHITNSAHLVVGSSLSLDQRLWIRCRLTSVIWHVVTSLSDVHWKHFCSLSTSVFITLEVFLRRCAIQIDIIYLSINRTPSLEKGIHLHFLHISINSIFAWCAGNLAVIWLSEDVLILLTYVKSFSWLIPTVQHIGCCSEKQLISSHQVYGRWTVQT